MLSGMRRELTDSEMDTLLDTECYGRLGCCTSITDMYIVPITYVHIKNAIYCFSFEGQKIDMMRKQKQICLQVDEQRDFTTWRSVIAWGEYEELQGAERDEAFDIITDRLWTDSVQGKPLYFPFLSSPESLAQAKDEQGVVLFRLNIEKRTGLAEEYN